jgi:hypothetical protein
MSKRNDPNTGKFTQGNPGRPKGTKNERTLLWEDLGKEIMERHTVRINDLLERLWDSPDPTDQLKAADLFMKLAEFFKPKLQRIQGQTDNGHGFIPPLVAHDGVVQVPHNWPGPIIHIHREVIGRDTEGKDEQ